MQFEFKIKNINNKYKIEKIWDNKIFAKKLENRYLSRFYDLIL